MALGLALVAHERRAADPIVPFHLLRTRAVAVASAALFLGTAALFAITVFVPLFLQTTTGASPTEAGLLLVPAMLGITVSTTLSGRSIARTGRYKRFPLAGLALMSAALALLAVLAGNPSQLATGIGLAVFGLGFGMVTQVLIVAVQNGVDRRELGIATATTGFFRALGGAVGAAVLGAVFAAQAGATASDAGGSGLGSVLRSDVIDGAQAVFAVAAPLALLGLLASCCSRRCRCARPALPRVRPLARAASARPGPTASPRSASRLRARASPRRWADADRGLYDWLLFGHIVAAMAWVGGGLLLGVLVDPGRARRRGRGASRASSATCAGSVRSSSRPRRSRCSGSGSGWCSTAPPGTSGSSGSLLALGLFAAAFVVGAAHQSRAALEAERARRATAIDPSCALPPARALVVGLLADRRCCSWWRPGTWSSSPASERLSRPARGL